MTDAAQLDAIAAAILAGTWSQALRRQLQAEWQWDNVRMDDAEGRIRRSLNMVVTTAADKEKMRWQLFDQYEEARLLAIQVEQPGAACTAIKGKVELLGLAVKADAKLDGAEMKTLADKERVATEARAALTALDNEIAQLRAERH